MHDPSHDESGRHGPALRPGSLPVVGRLIVAWSRIAIGGNLRGLVIGGPAVARDEAHIENAAGSDQHLKDQVSANLAQSEEHLGKTMTAPAARTPAAPRNRGRAPRTIRCIRTVRLMPTPDTPPRRATSRLAGDCRQSRRGIERPAVAGWNRSEEHAVRQAYGAWTAGEAGAGHLS